MLQALSSGFSDFECLSPNFTAPVRGGKLQCKSRFPEWWTASGGVAEVSGHFHSLTPETGIARTAFLRNCWDLVNSLWMLTELTGRRALELEMAESQVSELRLPCWACMATRWQRRLGNLLFEESSVVLNETLSLASVKRHPCPGVSCQLHKCAMNFPFLQRICVKWDLVCGKHKRQCAQIQ